MEKILVIIPFLSLLQPIYAGSIDQELYSKIHDEYRSPTMDFIMESMSRIGSRDVSLALLLSLSTFGNQKTKDASKLSVVSLASGQIVSGLLKALVNRERPEGTVPSRWNSSFPSGHAAGAFSLATVLSSKYPRLRIPLYIFATTIGISRVYLGSHYPSDVLVGAFIGYICSKIVLKYENAILSFSIW